MNTIVELTEKQERDIKEKLERLENKIQGDCTFFGYHENAYKSCLTPREYMEISNEIEILKKKLKNAVIVEETVALGNLVTLKKGEETTQVKLVVNPLPNISNCLLISTELGKALIGTKIGDVVKVDDISYEVIQIA